jgi:exodeoxyribonuclease V gamma subunit
LRNARLTGVLGNLSPQGLMAYRPAKVRANDRIAVWIRHLALNALAPDGVARTSCYAGEDAVLRFAPVEKPVALLEALVDLYLTGMTRPLHFFPSTACVYAERGEIDGDVRKTWQGTGYAGDGHCERDDPYYQVAFRGIDPLDAAFEHNARVVFGPMLEAIIGPAGS